MLGHPYFLKVFLASFISFNMLSIFVYFVLSVSFKLLILFFFISTSLWGSVFNPTTQLILGFSFKIFGIEFSFTKGILEVLYPLFAKEIEVGVLLVLLTPKRIMSDLPISFTKFPSSWLIVNCIASIR